MKKIIIIFLMSFILSGCYDYSELNDILIITGVSIDYNNDLYNVGFEILNAKKESKDSSKTDAYTVIGSGKSLSEAFNDASKSVSKRPYFNHLKILIVSESVAENHYADITDFFLRTPDVRNEFYPIIAYQMSAYDLLSSKTDENPIVSEQIESLLKSNKYHSNNSVDLTFEDTLTKILTFGEDAVISVVAKKDDKLLIYGLGIFKDYNLKGIITNDDAMNYNVITGNSNNAYFSFPCNDDKYLTLTIYDSNTDISFLKNTANVDIKLLANIKESNCNYDLNNPKTYEVLNDEYSMIFKDKIDNFLNLIKNYDTDTLGISRKYYLKTRKKDKNVWQKLKYNISVNFEVNKKGLIFEVKNDD